MYENEFDNFEEEEYTPVITFRETRAYNEQITEE